MRTLAVTGSVPHEAEDQIDSLVAYDRKIIVSPEIMVLLIVVDHLTVGIDGLNADELGLEDATNLVLNMSKALRNIHIEISTVNLIADDG